MEWTDDIKETLQEAGNREHVTWSCTSLHGDSTGGFLGMDWSRSGR